MFDKVFFRIAGTVFFVIAVVWLISCNTNYVSQTEISQAKDTALSIDGITEMIRKDPDNSELFNKRAEIYFALGDVKNAVTDAENALRIDSLKPEYYFSLAEYSIFAAKSEIARDALLRCIRIFPENAEAHLKLAEVYLYVREYQKSMEMLKIAENIDKQIGYTYFIKSIIYKELGDTSRAIENLLITVEKEPDFYNAYMMLGLIHASMKDSLAKSFYESAISIAPMSVEAHYGLAMYYQESGKYQEAIEIYGKISVIDSLYPYSYFNTGYIQLEYLNEYDKAVLSFSKAIDFFPEYFEAIYNRGRAYELLNKYDLARNDFNKALEIKPNYELSIDGLNRLDALK